MKYLIDTSALVRIVRRQTEPQWSELASRVLIAICAPVLVETLATQVGRSPSGRGFRNRRPARAATEPGADHLTGAWFRPAASEIMDSCRFV
ncbi:PIN domain-containing protein [Micromonospora craniellae]|uniref:PIN domain nuclease n=1 Tax=Micromonospora craniellae TaxID=2294034 RepID=UPI0011C0FE8E|nr:PIN domain nuclease [Micromonospora craniellae]QOC92644.1 hypothetical protein ID554_02425 [Micromonospora craniellae]